MSQKKYYQESRIFIRKPVDSSEAGVQFYNWMDSCFLPGFTGKSAGGSYAQYSLVHSGEYCIVTQGQRSRSCAGHFYISLRRTAYDSIYTTGDSPVVRSCFSVHHSAFHDFLVGEFFPGRIVDILLTDPDRIENIMQKIKAEIQYSQDSAVLAGLHMQLLCELHKQFRSNGYPAILNDILHYINNNLHQPGLCRDAVADKFNISVRTLGRLFNKYLLDSPGNWIIRCRIELVKSHLLQMELPLKEIAGNCGFSSVNFMVRQFHKNCGITPGAYRKKMLKND